MMNSKYTCIAFAFCFLTSWAADAQIQSVPVNFIIKKLVLRPEANRMGMKIDLEAQTTEGILSGPGVLSLCYCYCDSIWDAWPSEVGGGIPGTGTMYFLSSGDGGVPDGPQTGVLGIDMVEGGIERETEFRLSMKFRLED